MRGQRGIVAVEFAFIAPLLLALIMGAVEFGDRYKTTATYNNAALVAARSYSISNNAATATAAARNAGVPTSVSPTYAFMFDDGSTAASCAEASDGRYPNVTVTIRRTGIPAVTPLPALLPGVPSTFSITGKAVARCGV
jgi:Flp pilus assembly protein TadG